MCKSATCQTCHKTTFAPCGNTQHIPEVMEPYPKDQWCICEPRTEWRPAGATGVDGKQPRVYPPPAEKADGWAKRKRDLWWNTRAARQQWGREIAVMKFP